jgi:hypothetical protein
MAMVQYDVTSSISKTWLYVFYSKIGPLDEYVIFQTSENSYGCLIKRIPSKEVVQYNITRSGSNYGDYYYELTENQNVEWDYTINNELYVYSNVGAGTMEVLPVHQIMVCWSITASVCLLFLALVFKGALIKCLRPKKSGY